jgi:hypothetical protein
MSVKSKKSKANAILKKHGSSNKSLYLNRRVVSIDSGVGAKFFDPNPSATQALLAIAKASEAN